MLQQIHRTAQELTNLDSAARAKELQAQLEAMNRRIEQQKRRLEEQRRAPEYQLAAASAAIGAQLGVVSAIVSTVGSGIGSAVGSAVTGADATKADAATMQAKQYQALAEKMTAMVQEQQQALKRATEPQQTVVQQMAATLNR
jgi:glutathione S-transferase